MLDNVVHVIRNMLLQKCVIHAKKEVIHTILTENAHELYQNITSVIFLKEVVRMF